MSTELIIAIIVAGLMAAFLMFAVIRCTVRMAFRLALFGVVVLMMAIGALVIWWYLPGDVTGQQNRPASTRPARAR